MKKVLKGTESFGGAYDVVKSSAFPDHPVHLREIFTRLAEANLVVRHDNCDLGDAQVPNLGHLVGEFDVGLTIAEQGWCNPGFPKPQTKKDIRSFWELVDPVL